MYNRANKKPTVISAKSRIFWWKVAYALSLQTLHVQMKMHIYTYTVYRIIGRDNPVYTVIGRVTRKWKTKTFENVFFIHFRVNPTNDSINRVIPTDNSVYLYKYAFSYVQQS